MDNKDIFPVIIFPHSRISDSAYRAIGNAFGPITICQPWYMETPFHQPADSDVSPVQVRRPLDKMKPKGDFLKLLSEYRLWMKQNQDKGYAVYLKAAQDAGSSDDTPWDLRRMIKQMGEDFTASHEGNALKWHIILHLASEFETNRREAEEILNRVREQKGPLKDALEEGDLSKSAFGDLPAEDNLTLNDDGHLSQIFEAWFGLFGDFMAEDNLFLTFDEQVAEFAVSLFEDKPTRLPATNPGFDLLVKRMDQDRFRLNRLPFMEAEPESRRDPVIDGLSGKMVILVLD